MGFRGLWGLIGLISDPLERLEKKKNQIPEIAYFCKFLDCILGKYQPRQFIRRHFWKKKNSAVLASYLCS